MSQAPALTVAAIERMKPSERRREVPDGRTQGLLLVIQPSGAMSWAMRYRFAGVSRKLTFGPYPSIGLADARGLAAEARARIARNVDPAVEKRDARKAAAVKARDVDNQVENVVEEFITTYCERRLKARTRNDTARLLRKELEPWRGRPISGIDRTDIHRLLDRIIERGAPVGANRTHSWLNVFFKWARERGLLEANPLDGVKLPVKEGSGRERFLNDAELRLIWLGAGQLGFPSRQFVRMLILTAARRGEVAAMEWEEIDLRRENWTLPAERAKNGKRHIIPLTRLALAELESIPRFERGRFVLSLSQKPLCDFDNIKKKLDASVAEVAGEQGVSPPSHWVIHDLRRTCRSNFGRLRIPPHVGERVLNHVTGSKIERIYDHYDYADEMRAALDAWASHIETIVTGRPVDNVFEIAKARAGS